MQSLTDDLKLLKSAQGLSAVSGVIQVDFTILSSIAIDHQTSLMALWSREISATLSLGIRDHDIRSRAIDLPVEPPAAVGRNGQFRDLQRYFNRNPRRDIP